MAMSFYVKKLKICNFLSFFGSQEVDLEPFTAVMCNYERGKADFLRAIEFVFGKSVEELNVESLRHLINKAHWKANSDGNDMQCFVEITLDLTHEKKIKTIYRGITICNFEYKIDEKVVSKFQFEEILNKYNLNLKHKNLIAYKQYFDNIIWGTAQELETIITKILRGNTDVYRWKEINFRVKSLKESNNLSYQKKLFKMKRSHGTLEKFIDIFINLTNKMVCVKNDAKVLEEKEDSDEDYLPVISPNSKVIETECASVEEAEFNIKNLEDRRDFLAEKYNNLGIRKNELLSELYYNEIKIASKSANSNILQERIFKLKAELRKAETNLSSIWKKMQEVDIDLLEINRKISAKLAFIKDYREFYNTRNRFTTYGRLIDYLQTDDNFIKILQKILGDNILYANLCDKTETAMYCCKHLKEKKYERRETFIPFEKYSTKLKDLIISSDEKGIIIDSLQNLQIFLCKLKQYGLIERVPIILRQSFDYALQKDKNHENDVIYLQDHILLMADGIIVWSNDTVDIENEEIILQQVNDLLKKQELEYQEYWDLICLRSETLQIINTFENDISYLKFYCKTYAFSRFPEHQSEDLPKVYEEFMHVFQEHEENLINAERELQESEEYLLLSISSENVSSSENSPCENVLNTVSAEIEEIENVRINIRNELSEITKKIRLLNVFSHKVYFLPTKKFILLEQPKKTRNFYLEKELEKLKLLMNTDEIDEFVGWKDWRKRSLNILIEGFRESKHLADTMRDLTDLTAARKKILLPLLEHCSLYLTPAINRILDASVPFLDLAMNSSQDGLQLLSSLPGDTVNVIDISHFNTFLKTIAALVLLLEIAVYDKVPVLFLDDIQEFLPIHNDTFEAVLDEHVISRILSTNENVGFQMLMRIGQYLKFFIKKNTPRNSFRKNVRPGICGPMQIIYFSSEDFINAAQFQIWISSRVLMDECISSDCDSYSVIEKIQFE